MEPAARRHGSDNAARALAAAVALIAACGRFGFEADRGDACPAQVFYADADGDGHGDATAPVSACAQPAGTSISADDCDDTDRYRFPGATEVCDGADNDCSAATVEQCLLLCAPARRPAPDAQHTYLLCGADRTWPGAQQACADQGFTLATIDDAAEDGWVLSEMTARFGAVDVFVGGTDAAAEGAWRWPDGAQFWQGGNGGMAVDGRYQNWGAIEPNNGGAAPPENCLMLLSLATWNDADCVVTQRKFACERI